MSIDLEEKLREALRPVEPDEGFAERVLARIEGERPRPRRELPQRFRWLPVALAASAVLGVVLAHEWQVQRERQGLEAREQLLQALRLTGEKLDLAYRGVNGESRPARPDHTGA